jgi:hypothetical protein
VALLEKRRYLNNRSGDFPQVILIVPSHVPNTIMVVKSVQPGNVKWIMQQKSFAVEIRDMQYYSITYINNPLLPLEILRIQLGTLHVF